MLIKITKFIKVQEFNSKVWISKLTFVIDCGPSIFASNTQTASRTSLEFHQQSIINSISLVTNSTISCDHYPQHIVEIFENSKYFLI